MSQVVLLPMAFTIDATHDGPEPSVIAAWSEASPLGITQFTLASLQLGMSFSTSVGATSTYPFALGFLIQSGPIHFVPAEFGTQTASSASGADHSEPWPGV